MVKTKDIPPEGSHAHDVLVTTEILEEARQKGYVSIPNTVDGDIDIFFDAGKRLYAISQSIDGQVMSQTSVHRRFAQAYIIELRERRRDEEKKARKKAK